jgi:hypothetical protein
MDTVDFHILVGEEETVYSVELEPYLARVIIHFIESRAYEEVKKLLLLSVELDVDKYLPYFIEFELRSQSEGNQ